MNCRRFLDLSLGLTALSGCVGRNPDDQVPSESESELSTDGDDVVEDQLDEPVPPTDETSGDRDGGPSPTPDQDDVDGFAHPTDRLVIREHEMTREESHGWIENTVEGTAENVSDHHINSTLIHVRFYDEDGELLQRFGDRCVDVPPGGTCRFDVVYGGSSGRPTQVTSYEVEVAVVT